MRVSLCVRVGRAGARAELVRRSKVLWAGEASFTTPEELFEAVYQLFVTEALPARPAAVRVELDPPLAQVRKLRNLPPVRTSQLRRLVHTQAGRFFRRNGKQLVTDACWIGRRGTTAVAAAAEEPWVEAVVAATLSAGLQIEAIEPAGLPAGARLSLLPSAERRRQREQARLSARRVALAACTAWFAAGIVFLVRVRQESAAIDREITQLETSASAVGTARRALGEAARLVKTMDRAESERGRVLVRLSAIAGSLPDSAFITGAVLEKDGRGELSVVARRSAEVMTSLARTGAAPSPSLIGAVVHQSVGQLDWERMTIGFGPESAR